MRNVSIMVALVFTILSCSQKNGDQKPRMQIGMADTVDLPEWVSRDSAIQKDFSDLVELVGLPSLSAGYNGLQIRVWIGCSPRDTQATIQLIQRGGNWEAKFCHYKIKQQEDGSLKINDAYVENKVPRSGWAKFGDELIRTGIKDLPDFSLVEAEYDLPSDPLGMAVEVATINKYRRYHYPELGLNKNLVEGPQKLNNALELIEKEFNFRRPCQR